ncbi:MAG: Cof-type HAD-IIB family hydrolase [Snowella sp.]
MDIRLLVLDIDGTIAGESNNVREPIKAAIKAVQTQGIQVALATGRMYHSALPFYHAIGSQLPLIAYNGALIKDPQTDKTYQELSVTPDIALALLDHLERPQFRSRLDVHCYYDDQLYVREITLETERYKLRSGAKPVVVPDLRSIAERSSLKLLVVSQDATLIQELITHFSDRFNREELHVTQSTEIYLELTHPQANKGLAVRHLTEEILGLTSEQVMAIGDNFNDLEMLRYAEIGVAMGNAPLEVQAIADWVTIDVEEDGVAIAIQKFLLGNRYRQK